MSCRLLVDVATSSSTRCAACGSLLETGAPSPTIWDDDDPTERRPPDYYKQLESRR